MHLKCGIVIQVFEDAYVFIDPLLTPTLSRATRPHVLAGCEGVFLPPDFPGVSKILRCRNYIQKIDHNHKTSSKLTTEPIHIFCTFLSTRK